MASLNKVQLIGRLGRDCDMKYSAQGVAICKMAIATSESWTDKNTGQKNEKTEWHRVTCFSKMAENCGKYLSKGSQVYIEGKLQTTSYEKEGQKHFSTDILANIVQFLDSKPQSQPQGQQGGYQPQIPPQQQYQPPKQQYQPQNHGYQPQGATPNGYRPQGPSQGGDYQTPGHGQPVDDGSDVPF